MCIGIPMQVVEAYDGYALCEADGQRKHVNTLMVGDVSIGSWLLVFLDNAREILSSEDAGRLKDALKAVEMAVSGNADVDHLFADLVGREPLVPEFLKSKS